MKEIPLLSVVALLEDQPEAHLQRGQVGTVVDVHGPDVYEVEFSDDLGRTYACVPIEGEHLLVLRHEPSHQVA